MIIFLDTQTKINLDEIKFIEKDVDLPKNTKLILPKRKTLLKNLKTIGNLQENLIDCLNFQKSHNLIPSDLPNTINIKFTKTSYLEQINPFLNDDSAITNIKTNTIYISTDIIKKNKTEFFNELINHFPEKESVIKIVFLHEFGHIIFNHQFHKLANIGINLNLKDQKYSPLYQCLRNLEENFCDAYSAYTIKENLNQISVYPYLLARNNNQHYDSKKFDFNLYQLGNSFKNLDHKIESEHINKIMDIAIDSSLEIVYQAMLKNKEFKDKLIKDLNLKENTPEKDIVCELKNLIDNHNNIKNNVMNDSLQNNINKIRNFYSVGNVKNFNYE